MADNIFRETGLDSVWSGATGKGTSEDRERAADAANDAVRLATGITKDYYNATVGMRGSLIDQFNKLLSGNYDVTTNPLYGSLKNVAETQYQTSMDDLLATVPQGGGLQSGIADLMGNRASTMVNSMGSVLQDMYNKAYAMGQGSQEVSASGASNAASAGSALVNALANQTNAGANTTSNWLKLIQMLKSGYTGSDSSADGV